MQFATEGCPFPDAALATKEYQHRFCLQALILLLAVMVAGVSAATEEAEPPLAYLEQWWTWPTGYSNGQADAANAAAAAAPASIVAGTAAASTPPGKTSVLWGRRGERWTPSGPLMDFSYAGGARC
jgi:hypothetical protein